MLIKEHKIQMNNNHYVFKILKNEYIIRGRERVFQEVKH